MARNLHPFLKYGIALICLQHAAFAAAAPCDDHFATSGGPFSAKTYKTWADLPGADAGSAFNNASAFTAANGFKILSSDRNKGAISAVQESSYKKGDSIPLDIAIAPSASGVQLSMTYTTPVGKQSPESAIRNHFCKTIEAAAAPQAKEARPVATASPADSPSNEYVKNGMPCINGICIGDDIATLGKVKWDVSYYVNYANGPKLQVRNLKLDDEGVRVYTRGLVAGANSKDALRAAAPYLMQRSFDSDGIPKLTHLKGFCTSPNVYGRYKSENGFDTTVLAILLPDGDTLQQSFRVMSITRSYPATYTREQVQELERQFEQRYAGVHRYAPKNSQDKAIQPFWNIAGREFSLNGTAVGDIQNQMKKYPGCGQELKLD
ncbi:hypothetical protein [Pseudoduganella violaceinigra]|uniref:hypothetical protein n=1 Tax=Pseudoduganella violaceinigra TaxID=246602 RepID=UPI0003F52562|nr:hypothetical protein [Pseudoduganella violaceinigra]